MTIDDHTPALADTAELTEADPFADWCEPDPPTKAEVEACIALRGELHWAHIAVNRECAWCGDSYEEATT